MFSCPSRPLRARTSERSHSETVMRHSLLSAVGSTTSDAGPCSTGSGCHYCCSRLGCGVRTRAIIRARWLLSCLMTVRPCQT